MLFSKLPLQRQFTEQQNFTLKFYWKIALTTGTYIGIGDIISGNHNDLYDIIGQFSKIMNQIKNVVFV